MRAMIPVFEEPFLGSVVVEGFNGVSFDGFVGVSFGISVGVSFEGFVGVSVEGFVDGSDDGVCLVKSEEAPLLLAKVAWSPLTVKIPEILADLAMKSMKIALPLGAGTV